jgi:hypothetical protein
MVNLTLLWMLLIPFFFTVFTFLILPKLTTNEIGRDWKTRIGFCVGGLLVSAFIMAGMFYASIGMKTHDTQILNGEITSKDRVHGSYIESYDCNCKNVTTTSGSGKNKTTSTRRVCDTCYRDHFTVKWYCQSNVGGWTIDYKDWTNRGVYALPDPARYTSIKIGDPASVESSYTNYIKAVPESLFKPASTSVKQKYAAFIPAYPENVFDYYRINRVLSVGVNIPNLQEWNNELSLILRKIGPQKQANIVFVITKFDNPDYVYALQDAWTNGKKNDIIIVIGAPEFPKKAEWIRVLAYTDRDLFRVKLRDELAELETLDVTQVMNITSKVVMSDFKRKRMSDFKYLEDEIDPPEWVIVTAILLNIFAYLGAYVFVALGRGGKFQRRQVRRF